MSRLVHVASVPFQSPFSVDLQQLFTACLRPSLDGQQAKVPKTSFLQHPVEQKEGVSLLMDFVDK